MNHVHADSNQQAIADYFENSATYWGDVYEFSDVDGAIYRNRRSVVLALGRGLALPLDSAILEIGCGAGLMTVQLAQQGYTVHAVDSAQSMVACTLQHAEEAGVGDRVIAARADVERLGFPDNTFDLALKIGVAPWLSSLKKALHEVVRVLRPGGYLIITADNWWRLNHWLDPRFFPPLGAMRKQARRILERLAIIPPPGASARLHSIREFDDCLSIAGLNKIEATTLGFGPFTFLGLKLLSDCRAVRVHQRLQDLADRGIPLLRSMGNQYIVLARKPLT